MRAEINKKGKLEIFCDLFDLCETCQNIKKCPLIQAISQEIVILHYSDIVINKCGLYQKRK